MHAFLRKCAYMPICVLVDLSPGHSEIPLFYSEYIAQDPTNLIKTGVCITNLRLVGLETASTTQGPAELSGTCPSRSTHTYTLNVRPCLRV